MKDNLSRRERQIMNLIYQLGEATANDVVEGLPDDVANATVRTQLRLLESKGLLKHRVVGRQFIYQPKTSRKLAAKNAFKSVLRTFFGGSVEDALAAHLADPKTKLDPDQLQRMRDLIDEHERGEDR